MLDDIIKLMKKGRQKILSVVLLVTFGIYLILKSDTLVWFYFFGLLTVSCCFLGPLVIILIHVALSPNHQTGAGTAKTVIEMDAFRTMLMVRIITILFQIFPRHVFHGPLSILFAPLILL